MGRIGVVDYGMGNLRSILNAFAEIEQDAALVSEPDAISGFDRIVIPGVGAFAQAMENLRESGMAEALHDQVAAANILHYTEQATRKAKALLANAGVPARSNGQSLAPMDRHLY